MIKINLEMEKKNIDLNKLCNYILDVYFLKVFYFWFIKKLLFYFYEKIELKLIFDWCEYYFDYWSGIFGCVGLKVWNFFLNNF